MNHVTVLFIITTKKMFYGMCDNLHNNNLVIYYYVQMWSRIITLSGFAHLNTVKPSI